MNPIFYQVPNWADGIAVFIMGTFFVEVEIVAAMVGIWAIAELGLLMYHRLHSRYQIVVLGL